MKAIHAALILGLQCCVMNFGSRLEAQDPTVSAIDRQILGLSSDNAEARSKAADELVKFGKDALPALMTVCKTGDLDLQIQAKGIIDRIEWSPGIEAARKYASDFYSGEEVTVDFMKMRALVRYFPDKRLIEVRPVVQVGKTAPRGIDFRAPAARAVLISTKYSDKISPVSTNGIYVPSAIMDLVKDHSIKLESCDDAINLAQVFTEIYYSATGVMLYGSRLIQDINGWILQDRNFNEVIFRTSSKDKILQEIVINYNDGTARSGTRERLEVEKLKIEIELLKKQLSLKLLGKEAESNGGR